MKLQDNTLYRDKEYDDSSIEYPQLPNDLKKEDVKFIKNISGKSILDLIKNNDNLFVWPHSFQDCKDELNNKHILDCTFNDNKIETLLTGNLVGFIGKDKTQLEIGSRFSPKNSSSDLFLYHMLSKVFDINIVNMEHGKGKSNNIDLLIFIFVGILKDALRQGVYKQYIRKKYNDTNLRGTIDISRHIRYNYPPNGRIAYNTREYSYDNYVTQLIRHTIEYLEHNKTNKFILTIDKEVEECIRIIKQVTPTYNKNERRKIMINNNHTINHPYFTRYIPLQKICLALLRGDKISYNSQNKDKVNGLLIDIAWLWEEYLSKILSVTNFKHCTSRREFYLFRKEDSSHFQSVVPDFLYENDIDGEKKYIVADAKYIPLNRYDHLEVERAMPIYYKTIMYMYRFHTNIGLLFYPIKAQDANQEESIVVDKYEIANDKNCNLYKVGIIIPYNVEDFSTKMNENEKAFASLLKKSSKAKVQKKLVVL